MYGAIINLILINKITDVYIEYKNRGRCATRYRISVEGDARATSLSRSIQGRASAEMTDISPLKRDY